MFKPQDTLDRVFEIGIVAKGLNGLAELVGGLLLLFVSPGDIHHLVAMLTQGELSEDPRDLIARYLLHTADGLTGSALLFGAAYGSCRLMLCKSSWLSPILVGVRLLEEKEVEDVNQLFDPVCPQCREPDSEQGTGGVQEPDLVRGSAHAPPVYSNGELVQPVSCSCGSLHGQRGSMVSGRR